MLPDLLALVQLYEAAGERMLNTSPYNQHAEAVQLMTVFKAKGLEFEHVFLPSCQDDVWGESSRGQSNRLTLPPNLAPIRPAGTTQDERLRIFFVAVTRAKLGLHLTSYLQSYSGKATKRLKYLHEVEDDHNTFQTLILPAEKQTVHRIDHQPPRLDDLELNWRHRHLEGLQNSSLRGLLSERLIKYQLSPTHLTTFLDLVYGGPEAFFFNCLLNFPGAPSDDAEYGNAIHETLQWYQLQINQAARATDRANEAITGTPVLPADDSPSATMPSINTTQAYFAGRLQQKHLPATRYPNYLERGNQALDIYLQARGHTFRPGDKAEYNFRNEGVLIGMNNSEQPVSSIPVAPNESMMLSDTDAGHTSQKPLHLTGKIDRMLINRADKTITVIDYKTGSSFNRWVSDHKLHKYRLQLYCYKLLIERSHTYRGYRVEQGILEFVEPDDKGAINALTLDFNDQELQRTVQLLSAAWQKIQTLDLPDVSSYDPSFAGSKQFEADLLAE
jgi:DNA helicase-2/ATP-dependent DNA helicase PcrA